MPEPEADGSVETGPGQPTLSGDAPGTSPGLTRFCPSALTRCTWHARSSCIVEGGNESMKERAVAVTQLIIS
jgi:hypothetical protein